jgi:hypothetical protein
MYTNLALYIDGRFVEAEAGRVSEPVLNPATGATLTELDVRLPARE